MAPASVSRDGTRIWRTTLAPAMVAETLRPYLAQPALKRQKASMRNGAQSCAGVCTQP